MHLRFYPYFCHNNKLFLDCVLHSLRMESHLHSSNRREDPYLQNSVYSKIFFQLKFIIVLNWINILGIVFTEFCNFEDLISTECDKPIIL